jgi:hypothetical protein
MSLQEIKEPCNILLSEFTSLTGLTIEQPCPACKIVGAFHHRTEKPQVVVTSTNEKSGRLLSATANAFMKLESHLPKFDIKNTECCTFLKQVDLVLEINDGIPKEKWPRVFLYIIKDPNAANWIKENIIDTNMNWDDAKKAFIFHFQRADYNALLINKFDNIKQLKDETVQNYSHRFINICKELRRPDDDPLVISHYLKHLNCYIMKQFQIHLTSVRIQKKDREFQYSSLKEVIEICIMFDIQSVAISSNLTTSNSTIATSVPLNSTAESSINDYKKSNYDKSKYCEIHKIVGHDISSCNLRDKNINESKLNNDSHGTKPFNKANITCNKCSEKGHYANECPGTLHKDNSVSPVTVSGTSSNSYNILNREKREIKPPERSTFDKLGGNVVSTTGNVSTKRAVICARATVDVNKSGIWLIDPINNRKFKTLVDTGASVSFMDAELARELGIKMIPVVGNVTLAGKNTSIPRQGYVELPFIAMIGKANLNVTDTVIKAVKHKFELLKLDTDEHHFIIGCDLLPTFFPNGIPIEFYSDNVNKVDISVNNISTSDMGGGNAVKIPALLDDKWIASLEQFNKELDQQILENVECKQLNESVLEDHEIKSLKQWNENLDQHIMDEHEKIQNEIVDQCNVSVRAAGINAIGIKLNGQLQAAPESKQENIEQHINIPSWLRNVVSTTYAGIDPNDDHAITSLLHYNGIYDRDSDSDGE